jgi:hypothetical protein
MAEAFEWEGELSFVEQLGGHAATGWIEGSDPVNGTDDLAVRAYKALRLKTGHFRQDEVHVAYAKLGRVRVTIERLDE